jgi:hypothetical protein
MVRTKRKRNAITSVGCYHPHQVCSSPCLDWHPSSAFPLGLCEGDCDTDSDVSRHSVWFNVNIEYLTNKQTNKQTRDSQCAQGLRCFQRSRFQAVPGCTGGENDSSSTDYCIPCASHPNPTPNPTPGPHTPYPTPRVTPRPTPWPTKGPDPQPNQPVVEVAGNSKIRGLRSLNDPNDESWLTAVSFSFRWTTFFCIPIATL